jgi:hypothetical protein
MSRLIFLITKRKGHEGRGRPADRPLQYSYSFVLSVCFVV